MSTLTKIIVSTIIGLLMLSCNFDISMGQGVTGNGNVTTVERDLTTDFNEIKVSRGLDVYLTQSNDLSLSVEADENLHDIIMTEVENGVLKIYATENIRRSSSKKIMVSFKDVSNIKATSGSDVYSENTFAVDNLELSTTSGADMEIDVNAKYVNCKSTSGSDLKITGKTDKLDAEATSGSDLKAGDLIAKVSNVKVTSGADITVNTSKELTAKASSGGDIKYYGNPEKVNKKEGASGNIRKQ